MLERDFQAKLIKKIKNEYPGCIVMKTDPTYIQGLPDLIILYGNKWAALECKLSNKAHHQPNQDYYVEKMDNMSYAAFISPDNEFDVLEELFKHFADTYDYI